LPRSLDAATQQALAARLRFYRDLGLTEFYRRPFDPAKFQSLLATTEEEPVAAETSESGASELGAPGLAFETWEGSSPNQHAPAGAPGPSHLGTWEGTSPHQQTPGVNEPNTIQEETPISARKSVQAPPQASNLIPPADREAALRLIREDIGDCTRCALHKGRNKIVFADGSANARLMFVGEGPGADEDAQGIPFVGRAGQLLNNMIAAMGLKREEVYIANVVKCRPPGNRTPEPEEANTCSPFLFEQIDVVRPEVLVALGATAATYLLGQRQPLAGLRGRVHSLRGSRLIVTYHPAYLLRDPRQKKEAWADLQIAMKELGLKAPGKS
jgi:DNA polymerase